MTLEVWGAGSGWGSKVSNADERSQGDETNLARRWTLTASKFPWSGRRGPAGGETGQEGRGQGQVLPQNEDWGGVGWGEAEAAA